MNNKTKQIKQILDRFADEDYIDLEKLNEAKELLDKCVDSSQIVIAYTRDDLDDELGRKSTDDEWEWAWSSIHNNDTAWSYMSDACYEAECTIREGETVKCK